MAPERESCLLDRGQNRRHAGTFAAQASPWRTHGSSHAASSAFCATPRLRVHRVGTKPRVRTRTPFGTKRVRKERSTTRHPIPGLGTTFSKRGREALTIALCGSSLGRLAMGQIGTVPIPTVSGAVVMAPAAQCLPTSIMDGWASPAAVDRRQKAWSVTRRWSPCGGTPDGEKDGISGREARR